MSLIVLYLSAQVVSYLESGGQKLSLLSACGVWTYARTRRGPRPHNQAGPRLFSARRFEALGDTFAQLLGEVARELRDVLREHGHLDLFHIITRIPTLTLDPQGEPTASIFATVNFGSDAIAVVNVDHTLPEGSRSGPKCYLDSP